MKTPELTPELRTAGLIDWLNSLRADVVALEHGMLSEAAPEPAEMQYMREQRAINLHIEKLQEENTQLRSGNPVTYHISWSPDGD